MLSDDNFVLLFILQCICPEIVNATCNNASSDNNTGNLLLPKGLLLDRYWSFCSM